MQHSSGARIWFVVLALAAWSLPLRAQNPTPAAPMPAPAPVSAASATGRYLESIRNKPGLVLAFVREMPKGGDLHVHLSGAIYAESFIEWGAQSGACVRLGDMRSVPAPCDSSSTMVPLRAALRDDDLYGRIVDAWSMRNWSRALGNGHDRFFDSFGKFSAAGRGRSADMLAEAANRAAADRISYLEVMQTPNDGAAALGSKVGWDENFANMRDKLETSGLTEVVEAARNEMATTLAHARELMQCADSTMAQAGCNVQIRFLYQVLRGHEPEQVFTQILAGFETASIDTLIVGFNLVMPEDCYICMRDFSLHMRMMDYLHGFYPNVRISLHAGELAPGLVTPEGLGFHIRESVKKAHASRIGHGVDVMHEDSAIQLLREMAQRGVAVEICLTSNDVILGVSGRDHPLAQYRAYGVPTLLATDDQGVARSDLNMEFKRAVEEQGLGYSDLKAMARNSIKFAFVQDSVKVQLLEKLDRDFATFEARWSKLLR